MVGAGGDSIRADDAALCSPSLNPLESIWDFSSINQIFIFCARCLANRFFLAVENVLNTSEASEQAIEMFAIAAKMHELNEKVNVFVGNRAEPVFESNLKDLQSGLDGVFTRICHLFETPKLVTETDPSNKPLAALLQKLAV